MTVLKTILTHFIRFISVQFSHRHQGPCVPIISKSFLVIQISLPNQLDCLFICPSAHQSTSIPVSIVVSQPPAIIVIFLLCRSCCLAHKLAVNWLAGSLFSRRPRRGRIFPRGDFLTRQGRDFADSPKCSRVENTTTRQFAR